MDREMIESLSEIRIDSKTKRKINKKYREQMKKWAPKLVESDAPPINKALAAMLTEIWEPKRKAKPGIHTPRRRRGGYGIYDLRMLRLFGEWIRLEELGELDKPLHWRVTACYSDVIRAKDADEAARFFRAIYPVLESDWLSLSVEVSL